MRVNDFVSAFKHPAKTNKFRIIISFPGSNDRNDIFFCKGTTTPTKRLGKTEIGFQGRKVPFAGDLTFEDWNVTVYNDIGFTIKNKLETWLEIIMGTKSGVGSNNTNDYVRSAVIERLDNNDKVIKRFNMEGIFPLDDGGTSQLDWDTNDTAEEYEVQFAITGFTTENTK